jgi:hypothetical protein
MDVLVMRDGSQIFLYSMNPMRRHGMVLQEGTDIDYENGTLVFTNDHTKAAFAGDAKGSAIFVVSNNSKVKTGIHRIGTRKTLWTRLEEGAISFWERTRKLVEGPDTGPIIIDVRTPNAKVTPEGTAFWLSYDKDEDVTELVVFEGRAAFQPSGIDLPPVWVEPGYAVRASGSESPMIEVGEADPNRAGWLYDNEVMPAIAEVERRR